MAEQPDSVNNKAGKCLLHNWAEERAVAALDAKDTKAHIQKHGHRGILTVDQESKMETVSTLKASYISPKGPGVRLRGIRNELVEKQIAQMISEKIQEELNPPTPKTDFCSTTKRDFCVEGFVPLAPQTTQLHDYKAEQAITFWSENYQRIQGMSTVGNPNAPFRKSALFSTPVRERLDEIELDDSDNMSEYHISS